MSKCGIQTLLLALRKRSKSNVIFKYWPCQQQTIQIYKQHYTSCQKSFVTTPKLLTVPKVTVMYSQRPCSAKRA